MMQAVLCIPGYMAALMYSFPNLEPVRCSMSGSNCCFLICIQVSQEAGKVVWYSHLLKNFKLIHYFLSVEEIQGRKRAQRKDGVSQYQL